MTYKLVDYFHWSDIDKQSYYTLIDADKYQLIVDWARKARGKNPNAFDAVTEWILDDSEWSDDKLPENEQILMHGIFARFRDQNAQLRAYLRELEPSGVVNKTVFGELDFFDEELSGNSHANEFKKAVSDLFTDFTVMKDRSVRELIAGNKTGPSGTDSVNIFGFINLLKEGDARVQWALFMPYVVKMQQNGFRVESFECKKMPAMRFIGFEGEEYTDIGKRLEKMKTIHSLTEYMSELDFDVFFMHHYGLGVDIGEWHGLWGRFMKADTPVPEGFVSFDFIPDRFAGDFNPGPPYLSQFTYAVYSGDMEAIHRHEGYDSDAMYDVTRNIMLGQGLNIPYPDKYWTAEVFLNGYDNYSTAYMFSAEF